MHCVTEGITKEHLKELYSDSYITKVGNDSRSAAPISHPLVTYLSAWTNNVFSGAFLIIKYSKFEYELHALLKRSFALESRELGKKCIDWAFSNPSVLRVTAYVTSELKTVINYCKKLGFKHEGIRRDATVKDGTTLDIHILGIIRKEWSESWVV